MDEQQNRTRLSRVKNTSTSRAPTSLSPTSQTFINRLWSGNSRLRVDGTKRFGQCFGCPGRGVVRLFGRHRQRLHPLLLRWKSKRKSKMRFNRESKSTMRGLIIMLSSRSGKTNKSQIGNFLRRGLLIRRRRLVPFVQRRRVGVRVIL